MTVTELTRLNAEQIKPKIGSRVLNSKAELLSGQLTDEINELLERRGVLVFPEIHFTDEEQVAFSNMLGGNATDALAHSERTITTESYLDPKLIERTPPNEILFPLEAATA